jgi:hypothetical protein
MLVNQAFVGYNNEGVPMTNVLPFRQPVCKELIGTIEELLQDAKDGKIDSMIWMYWNEKESYCKRSKHLKADANGFTLLGILQETLLQFHSWMIGG